jgi:hypothetical protein
LYNNFFLLQLYSKKIEIIYIYNETYYIKIKMEYITKDNTIIFSPEFNKPLDPELLLNYKKIIFSNYELNYSLFEVYENNYFKNLHYIGSMFNQTLDDSLNKLTSLTHLTFGYRFNQKLDDTLNKLTSLTHLTFGYSFNQTLDDSLNELTSLTHLTFGRSFNHPLSNSLDKLTLLTNLTFGYWFNQPLINSLEKLTSLTHLTLGYSFNQKDDLPFVVKSITIECNNSYYTDFLPSSIEEIELGHYFSLELNNLPSSIKKISFYKKSKYNKELNCLPCGLKILQLPVKYNCQIKNIPNRLKKLICDKNYSFINDFSNCELETY